MITSRVRRAFRKLATSKVVELAKEYADNPTDPQAADAMMNALAEASETAMSVISDVYQTDQLDKARRVIADFYRNVNVPSQTQKAVERGDASYVINILRQMLQDSLEGLGVSEQAMGFRDELARLRAQDAPEDELMGFVDRMYASQIPRLADEYLHMKAPGDIAKLEALRRQGVDPKGAATRLVRQLLFENTRRMMMADLESPQSFAMKESDEKAYNTPPANVSSAIKYKKTGDQFDEQAPVGKTTLRNYYLMYVRPVIDSFPDARGGVDTVGLTQWLNEEFHNTGEPGEKITATTPDGQALTAPVSRKEFKLPVVQQWAQSVTQTQSLDAPAGDDDSASRVEMMEGKTTEDEDEKIRYYTENRERIRGNIAAYIDEAAAEAPIKSKEFWRESLRQAMRVKFGFGFDDGWVSHIEGSELGVPTKFYSAPMPEDKYQDIGRPKHKHWNQSRNPDWRPGAPKEIKKWVKDPEKAEKSPFRKYKKDWTQRKLWNTKTESYATSFPLPGQQGNYIVKDREHHKGEEANTPDFMDWFEYSQEQWKKDLEQAESNYDGQKWVDELVAEDLVKQLKEKGLTAVQKITPEKLLHSYTKNLDEPLLRAIGMAQLTASPQANKIFPIQNSFGPDITKMMRLFWEKAKGDEDVWGYLARKREGKIASLDMERTIRLAVDSLMRMRKAG